MKIRKNKCHECAECIRCGRDTQWYDALICDKCDEENFKLYVDGIKDLCEDCYLEEHNQEEGECTLCGSCDTLYDGLCKECFLEDAEVIEND